MTRTKKAQPVKLFRIFSGLFLIISVIVFAVLGIYVQYQDLQETYSLAQEATAFIKAECEKFDNYNQGNMARALQDLLDAGIGLKQFILPAEDVDDELLHDYIRTEHISGIILLDEDFSVIAQADMDDQDPFSMWEKVLDRATIRDIVKYPGKTYVDQETIDGKLYDFGVVGTGDGSSLVFCYSSMIKPSTDVYEMSIGSILSNNNFYKNPTMVITDGTQILSTNNETLMAAGNEPYEQLKDSIKWKDGQLTYFNYNDTGWYGLRRVYNDYYLYAVYPEKEVFSRRANYIVYGFMVYLVICLVVMAVQRYFDRQNMRRMGKQLRIIDAISTSYASTFLFHIDTRELEALRPSGLLESAFEKNRETGPLLDSICENFVSEKYVEKLRSFLDVSSIAKRVKGKKYIGTEIRDMEGKWYSVLLIPQKYDEAGNVQAVIVATRDMTAMKQAEELSYKDKLTGLYNRNYMEAKSQEFIQDGAFPVSVIMADCNYLKRTNDTLGHEFGDLLLQRVADGIKAVLPEACIAMRVGGDEFFLVCPHTSREKAEALVVKLKEQMAKRCDETLQVSVSFGVSTVENGEMTFEEAYEAADQEMYKEKMASRAGRE